MIFLIKMKRCLLLGTQVDNDFKIAHKRVQSEYFQ